MVIQGTYLIKCGHVIYDRNYSTQVIISVLFFSGTESD